MILRLQLIQRAKKPKAKIALLGSRGLPAKYGGFEQLVRELAYHLPKDVFDVYVACESSLKREAIHIPGVRLVYFPVFERFRIVSEVLYDILSLIWSSFMDIDIIYLLAYPAAPFCIIPRLLGKITIVNVDGLEWKRTKFPKFIRSILRVIEMLSVKSANHILCDSQAIQYYYRRKYNVDSFFIPNPVPIIYPSDDILIKKFDLKKYGYYLVVARLEPENNIDVIIRGFKKSTSSRKLVIVGPLKNTKYVGRLLEMRDKRVAFIGGVYDQKLLMALRMNCFAYLHGHEVGGTNPSLLEALGCANAVIALDISFNREVSRDAAIYFKKNSEDLVDKINQMEGNIQSVELMRKKAHEIAKRNYSRKIIINAYVNMFANFKSQFKEQHFCS